MSSFDFVDQNNPTTAKCKFTRNSEKDWCIYETSYENVPNIESLNEYIESKSHTLETFNLTRFIQGIAAINMDDNQKRKIILETLAVMKNRIITISMAGHKRYAPLGGYVEITFEEDLYKGGSKKTKNIKLNKKILKYMPFGGESLPELNTVISNKIYDYKTLTNKVKK
jgi:hypothetical protein